MRRSVNNRVEIHGNDAKPASARTVPLVSIVLPVFNGECYLRDALDSILAQSFADFELIAVDDCSTDATPEILAEYAARDARIRLHRNATNSKLPASLNVGFRLARGELFSWTSDDNLLRPHMLETLVAAAKANPGYAVFHSDYRLIDEDGVPGQKVAVAPADQLVFGNAVGCSFLYRREVQQALRGYDETLFGVEDYDFWLRAARQFAFFPIAEDLYLYRRHKGSLTSARARQIHALAAQVMLREIKALPRSQRRAEAYIRLLCRDPYKIRFGLLLRALRDHHWQDLALDRLFRENATGRHQPCGVRCRNDRSTFCRIAVLPLHRARL
jgi:glycosyltransferase involved in cell wall biosynthesis